MMPDITTWSVPTFCPWCYDHDQYPYAGIRTCRICGHMLKYLVATCYDPWHGGGG